ncbi:hypothetical protein [Jiangella mangrovi]|uniref:Htaa domain-containing protein n=1 Tax=Jiangella mangrovi TaxID=1524084 RepID=A0A7W9LL23_9ACTN|nr:hypothetical protein [Jiangella mangrovi]MBB5787694.1 hypothetical protein [Jiangella mangrovi]
MQTIRGVRRRWVAGVAATALTAAGLLAVTAAPAQAGASDVDDATFVWGLNGYAQRGIFGPWTFKDLTGDAEQLVGSVSGGSQTEYVVAPVPATSMPPSSPQATPNAVKFSAGSGTIDPETGAGQLSWDGSYTVNAYPAQFNAPNEIYRDPLLTVNADGSGELSFDFSLGAGVDMNGNPTEQQDFGRLTLITFDAGSLSDQDATGYRITPDYQGVEVSLPDGGTQTRTCTTDGGATGWWGSWAPEFVTTMPSSVRPHFYSTGCGGMQDFKPPLPIDVAFTVQTSEPADGEEQDIAVVVPEPQVEPGEFVWSIDGSNDLVDLGTAERNGDHLAASGAINPVRVTDTRAEAPAWSVSAHVSDFSTGSATFDGKYLGWTPSVTENEGGAVAGAAVASGLDSGNGLKESATLGSAAAGHTLGSSLLGADLQLKLPVSVGAGSYTATLTLTALS